MANRITTLLDLDDRGFSGAMRRVRTNIAEADTRFGKFKAGATGAFQAVRANAGLMAAGAGAAIGAFALKGVKDFTNMAVAAGEMADATGLSTEQASQWISAAGDIGISGDDVEKVFLRLNKEIGEGGGVVEEYGIKAKRAADGQVDVNETMLAAVDVIDGIKDPTERARVAQELFGRSYANVAELMFQSSEDLRASLVSTSEQQVFDEDEVEEARKMRATMDQLQDAATDLALVIGERLSPVLRGVGDSAVWVDSKLDDLFKGAENFGASLGDVLFGGSRVANREFIEAHEAAEEAFQNFDRSLLEGVETVEEARKAADEWSEGLDGNVNKMHAANLVVVEWHQGMQAAKQEVMDLTYQGRNFRRGLSESERSTNQLRQALHRLKEIAEQNRAASDLHRAALDRQRTAFDNLTRSIEQDQSLLNLESQFENVDAAAERAWDAAAEGGREGREATRDAERAVNDLKLEVGRYGDEVAHLPTQVTTNLLAMIDQGRRAEVLAFLQQIGNGVTLPIKPRVVTTSYGTNIYVDANGNVHHRALGGRTQPGEMYETNERGPEVYREGGRTYLLPGGMGEVAPMSPAAGGAPSGPTFVFAGTVIGAPTQQVARQLFEMFEQHLRNGGQVPPTMARRLGGG